MRTIESLSSKMIARSICLLALIACNNNTATTQSDQQSQSQGSTGYGYGNGYGPRPSGAPGGAGGGGMGNMASFGAGFYVNATLPSGTSTGTQGSYSYSGFKVDCDTASSAQNILELTLVYTQAASSIEFNTDASFQTTCITNAKITVSPMSTGDTATLTVTVKSTSGTATSKGTTALFTQAAQPMPSFSPPSSDGTDNSGGTSFQRPQATEVTIQMNNI